MSMTDLVASLARATEDRRIPWKMVAPTTFEATVKRGAVRIQLVEGSPAPVVFELLNEAGETIESLRTEPLRFGRWRPYEEALTTMYNEARAQAIGVADVVDDLAAEFGLLPGDDNPS